MAKTVQPIAIELGIKGGEKLAALNRSFRDLSKQVKLSDADITQATKDIVKFATEAGNSEATIEGQIKAFEGLRKQAAMGGKAYVQLGKDIANLKSNLQGSTSAIDAKKKAILDLANSTGATSKQIQSAIDKLSALRTETKLDSSAFAAFGKDIEGLVAKLNLLDQQAEKAASKTKLLAGGIRATPGSIRAQAQAFKEEAANIQLQIDKIDNLASKERTLKKNVEERLGLQERLNKLLRSEAQTGFLASVESGRKAVISAANAFNDADASINSFNKRLQLLDDTFGKLPNTTAGFNQRLQELQKRFVNTIRDGGNYVSVALEIARVQREAAAATQGLGAALVNDLASGVAVRSQRNLREAIGQLQAEMLELNTTTAEGSAQYAQNAAQVNRLQKELDQITNSYRTVGDAARQANTAMGGGGINPFGAAGGRNPAYSREKEKQEMEQIAQLQQELNGLEGEYVDSIKSALQTIQEYRQKQHDNFMRQVDERISAEEKASAKAIENTKKEAQALDDQFNALLQQRKAAASAMGIGGRTDISSLYEGIIGLSTADIRRQQQMMGKSATEVFNDIATSFRKGGQAVDLKQKSTSIGSSIAEGVVNGASDSNEINSGAKTFAQRLIAAYKAAFGIRSPSKETEQKIGIPLGLGIIRGLLSALRSGKKEVQQEIESIAEPLIPKSRQPRRLIGTVNENIATFTGYGTRPRPAMPGYRPLPRPGQSLDTEIDRMFNQFRVNIAAVTTDAEIYYNLLQSLPTSKITTDLAAIASRRARAAEISGFMETQRQIGPGDLEREIASSVAGYMRELRTPNPWVGITGDYKQFINSISAETKMLRSNILALPPGRVAGLLPPAPTGLTPAQQRRVAQAYARSDERSTRISAEDASRGRALLLGQAGGGSGGGGSAGRVGGADGSFARLNKVLSDFGRLSDRSTADIRELGASLSSLGDILSPLDADFKQVNKAIADQSRLIDRELQKRERQRTRRRMSPMQMTQAAGAALSGGIFGGPEGFLGGAIGAIGGVGSAFAGAAIGAQIGGLRRQLGEFADYAAQIEKLKVALKGLTKDQSEFNYALAASQRVTQDFNVPQQESIRGITRLAAAIKGAGGPLTDAEVVFRNVTTAIKATGGSAQDVEGAVTAMVQVFSKGKVSAEELSGQLGERLPGAVTMFAKANNMSLTELQDNLKAGTVGLNELMNFVRSLGDTYGATARKISDSNAEAGARLQVVVDNTRAAIGDALIPIGAQLQDAFGEFLEEITPTLVDVLPKIGELFLGIVKNLDLIAQAAAAVFAVVVVGKITAIIASIGSLSAAIFTLKLNAIVATKSLIGLNAAALLNPYVALAAGAAALAIQINRAAQEQNRLNSLIREGSVADIDKKLAENRTKIIEIEQRQLKGADPRSSYQAERRAGLVVLPSQASLDKQALKQAQSLEKKLKEARKRAVYDAEQGADLPENLLRPFDYQSPKGDGGDGKGGSSAKEKRERKSQLESINARLTLLDIDKMIRANAREIVEAQADNNFERVKELSLQKLSLASQKEFESVQLDYRDALVRAAGNENEQMLKAEAAASRDRAIQELRFKLKEDMLDLEQQSRLEQEARTRAAEDEVFALREQLGLVSNEERISRYRADLEEQGTPNAEELTDLYRQTVDPTFAEGISQNIRALKKDLKELLNPINQITGAANAIGTSFADSFKSVISGSATAQEALAGFFKNIANYFLDMAAQIIQKWITMAILNAALKLFPTGNLTTSSGVSMSAGTATQSGYNMGSSLADMFKANGGPVSANQPYIVGERGPELFVPSRSGSIVPNDRLGGGDNVSVVVNVDAKGTSVQGNDQEGNQLGLVLSAAVKAELIKQKRPGGLLA